MTISTVTEAIDALGGTKAAAELCGVGETAISNYRVWNRFPEYLHLLIAEECKRRRLRLADDFFARMRRERRKRSAA